MKHHIFLTSGTAPAPLGQFSRGEVRAFDPATVKVHAERGTMKALDDLENDKLIYWLIGRGINPPDRAVKADLQKYLIEGKLPRKKKKSEEVNGDESS